MKINCTEIVFIKDLNLLSKRSGPHEINFRGQAKKYITSWNFVSLECWVFYIQFSNGLFTFKCCLNCLKNVALCKFYTGWLKRVLKNWEGRSGTQKQIIFTEIDRLDAGRRFSILQSTDCLRCKYHELVIYQNKIYRV